MSCPCTCLKVCDVPECVASFVVPFNNPVPLATAMVGLIRDVYGNERAIDCAIDPTDETRIIFDLTSLPEGWFNAHKGRYEVQVQDPEYGGCNYLCFVQGTDPDTTTYNCITVKAKRSPDISGQWLANFESGACTCTTYPVI